MLRGRERSSASSEAGVARALAMPLLSRPVELSVNSMESAWGDCWPAAPPLSDGTAETGERGVGAMTFSLDGMTAALAVMPVPIPNGELDGPAATSWMWPKDLRHELASVNAHVVAWVSGPGRPVDAHWNLTRLVAAVGRATDSLGVYWGAAGLVVRRDAFDAIASEYDGQGLPVMLWIDFRAYVENGRSSLFTVGLGEFGLMEIEVAPSTKSVGELRRFAMDLAAYLINSGPVLGDRHTVGGDANQRIVVRHRPSMTERKGLVYRLEGL